MIRSYSVNICHSEGNEESKYRTLRCAQGDNQRDLESSQNAYKMSYIETHLIRAVYLIASAVFILGLLISNSIADDIDKETGEISYLLMCPVCEGQTVGESNSELARQMRAIIKKKLQEGKSKDEIIAYFVSRYGEGILGAPPPKGANWLLWTLPAVALLIGGVGIGLFLYKSKEREKFQDELQKPPTQSEPEYIEKLDKELKEFEP